MSKKYTMKELSEHLNLSESEIKKYMESGDLNFTRLRGREIMFREKHVKNFMPVFERHIAKEAIRALSVNDVLETLATIKSDTVDTIIDGPANKHEIITGKRSGKLKESLQDLDAAKAEGKSVFVASDKQEPLAEDFKRKHEIVRTKVYRSTDKEGLPIQVISEVMLASGKRDSEIYKENDLCQYCNMLIATMIVGKSAQWRLCDKCAVLPKFNRYKIRKRIG